VAERVVVGGSIAALVAADALAAVGEDVRLLLPERGVGGGFAPIRRDGRELELGVRLLELSYEQTAAEVPPLRDYRAGVAGHRAYVAVVDRWTRELLGERVEQVERPRMLFDGRIVDDLYFTTDLLALRDALSESERTLIAAEARAAAAVIGCAAGLLDRSKAHELSLLDTAQASLRNHGETFHRRLIAPVADKIAGGAERVLATHRRKIWLPLFWPATLAEACEGGAVGFRPSRPFHTIAEGEGGGLIDALLERLRARGVRSEVAGRLEGLAKVTGGRVELRFSGLGEVRAARPILGPAPGELFAAAGAEYRPEQVRSVICWIETSPESLRWRLSLLNVVDPDIPALRISSGGRGAPGTQLLTVELRHDLPEDEIAPAALASLLRTGVVDPDAELEVVMSAAASTFALPTRAAAEAFTDARNALDALELDAVVVGGAAAFGADALAEQIIQGLQAAEVLSP
jgi:hypothetical protein